MAKKQVPTSVPSEEASTKEKKTSDESEKKSFMPLSFKVESDSSKDPIRIMIEIAENENLSQQDKDILIAHSQHRFTNRRKMAYLSLHAIIGSLVLLFLALFIDGISKSEILQSLEESKSLFIWIEGFLAAIVAAYYGVTAWKPAS